MSQSEKTTKTRIFTGTLPEPLVSDEMFDTYKFLDRTHLFFEVLFTNQNINIAAALFCLSYTLVCIVRVWTKNKASGDVMEKLLKVGLADPALFNVNAWKKFLDGIYYEKVQQEPKRVILDQVPIS